MDDPAVGRGVARFVGTSLREVGDHARGEVVLEGEAPLAAHLLDEHGRLRAGALLTMCDNVAGLCGGLASLPDGWVVSTNLMVRASTLSLHGAAVRFRSTVVRKGRNAVVTDVTVRSDDGDPVALGTLTSAVLVPQSGAPVWERPARMDHAPTATGELPDYYAWLGLRRDGAGDVVALDVFDALRNPWGIVHGGVTAALVDAAAAAAVPSGATYDAVVHYLSPNRVGPLRATPVVLGARPDGTVVRVDVRDAGADDRRTALAIVARR